MSGSELQRVREEYETALCGAKYLLKRCEESGCATPEQTRDFDRFLDEAFDAARRGKTLRAEQERKRERQRKARARKRAATERKAKWRETVRSVAAHEARHGALMERGACPVSRLELAESDGTVHGRAIAEQGFELPPWAAFVGHESDSDLAAAYAGAAAATAPGHSVWRASRGPHFEPQLTTWRADSARFLAEHARAIEGITTALMKRRHLSGDEVRDILRRHGAPTSK